MKKQHLQNKNHFPGRHNRPVFTFETDHQYDDIELAYYETLIERCNQQLKADVNKCPAILNTRGICKLNLAIARKCLILLNSALIDFKKIIICNRDAHHHEFIAAKKNHALANQALLLILNKQQHTK